MSVQRVCESLVAPKYNTDGKKTSFSLPQVTRTLLADPGFFAQSPSAASLVEEIQEGKVLTYIMQALVRFSLFIQLVQPDITTTWYEVRWAEREHMKTGDPRRATPQECMAVLDRGAELALSAWRTPEGRTVLEGLAQKGRNTDGIPLDYIDRHAPELHRASNIHWLPTKLSLDLVNQRSFLLNAKKNPYYRVFKAAYSKLLVKTYLTDRVLTGQHKTNRELRWETHPESVHFALRKDCMEIERVLVSQLCMLHGMPDRLRQLLIEEGLRDSDGEEQLCPVTLDPLLWSEFEAEMGESSHGHSAFQVGHMNPLKAINDSSTFGHSAKNVSWISMDGNRIQGSLSIKEVQVLLARIADNYSDRAKRASVLPENK